MKRLLIGTISFLLTCCVPCLACDCAAPGSASRYLKGASVVFVGRVAFTDDDGSGKFTQRTLVRFELEEAFKGLDRSLHDVWVDPGSFGSCYAEYRLGERYLVFAYGGGLPKDSLAMSVVTEGPQTKPLPPGFDAKNPPKVYVAAECSGTRQITKNTKQAIDKEIKYLRRLKAQAK